MFKHRRFRDVMLALITVAFAISMVPQKILSIPMETGAIQHPVKRATNMVYAGLVPSIMESGFVRSQHELVTMVKKHGASAVVDRIEAYMKKLADQGELTEQKYRSVVALGIFVGTELTMVSEMGDFNGRASTIASGVFGFERVSRGELQPSLLRQHHGGLLSENPSLLVAALMWLVLVLPKVAAFRFAKWGANYMYYGAHGVHSLDIFAELRLAWRVLIKEAFSPDSSTVPSHWSRSLLNGAHSMHAEASFVGWVSNSPYTNQNYFSYAMAAKAAVDKGEPLPVATFTQTKKVVYTQDLGYLARYLAHRIRENLGEVRKASSTLADSLESIISPTGEVIEPAKLARVFVTEVARNPWQLRHAETRNAFRLAAYATTTLFFLNFMAGVKEARAAESIFLQLADAGRKTESLFLQVSHAGSLADGVGYFIDFDHVVGSQAAALEVGPSFKFTDLVGVDGITFSPVAVAAVSFKGGPELATWKAGIKLGISEGNWFVFVPASWNAPQGSDAPDFLFTDSRVVHTVARFGEGNKYSLGVMGELSGTINTNGATNMAAGPGFVIGFEGGHLRTALQFPFGDKKDLGVHGLVSAVIPVPFLP